MYKEKIKLFIKLKMRWITKGGFTDWPENFLEKCYDIVDKWDCCEEIWLELHGDTCPFCVKYERCILCEFGKEFGICSGHEDNLWAKIGFICTPQRYLGTDHIYRLVNWVVK